MSDEKGYIKLYRGIRENEVIWEERATRLQAWIDLLLLANYKEKTIVQGYETVAIERGSFITSYPKLGERWGWDKRTVKRFMLLLQDNKMVSLKVDNHGIAVNIVNYCKYQGFLENDVPQNVPQNVPHHVPHHVPQNVPRNVPNIIKDKKEEESKEGKESIYMSNNSNELLDCPSEEQPDEEKHGAYDDLLKLWNSLESYGIQPIRFISEQRVKYLKPRLRQYGRESFAECVEQIRQSDFLQGKHGGKPWVITFDWMIKPTNYPKVLEGNYNNKKGNAVGNNQSSYMQDILEMMKGAQT